MKFVDKFVRRFEVSLHKQPTKAADYGGEFIRQRTPPDEREAERDEANDRDELMIENGDTVNGERQPGMNFKTRAKKAGKS
jgi:hypothetical protein